VTTETDRYTELLHRVDSLEGRIGSLEGRVGSVEGQLDVFREQVNERLRDMSVRLDRLTFSLFAVGGAIITGLVVLLVNQFTGG
jgi:hypothetical protein